MCEYTYVFMYLFIGWDVHSFIQRRCFCFVFSRDTATTCISHLSELIVALTKIAEVEIYRNASKYMKSWKTKKMLSEMLVSDFFFLMVLGFEIRAMYLLGNNIRRIANDERNTIVWISFQHIAVLCGVFF
jgi:hypothetical protein